MYPVGGGSPFCLVSLGHHQLPHAHGLAVDHHVVKGGVFLLILPAPGPVVVKLDIIRLCL